jgi:hypothetical protein
LIAAGLAVVVGLTLGIFGGGGAVLTVPIFIYALHVPEKSAIAMSLLVIGTASAVGAVSRVRSKRLDPRRGLTFGAAAMAGAFVGGRIGAVIPARLQLTMFAIAVIASAVSMLRSATAAEGAGRQIALGLKFGTFALIGMLTGIIGIGGGFLFVPALVTLAGIPVAEATGLSMMIIAMNATAGFAGYQGEVEIQWTLVLWFTAVVVAATLVASRFSIRIPVPVLKRAFAMMLIAVGGFVLFQKLY